MRDLRILSFYLVRESDLSKPAKLQLLNYLRDASDTQVKLFIATGEVGQVSKIDEAELDKAILEIAPLAAVIAQDIVFNTALNKASQAYSYRFGQAAKACADKVGPEKKLCKKRFILRSYHEKLRALKAEAPKCAGTNKPDKCRQRFVDQIKHIEKQITKARTKY
jgi:hypothetical protein